MPYEVRPKGSEFCVYKQDTDEEVACHPTKEKAQAQLRALYANEADMKALWTVKAADLSRSQLDRWMAGEIPRRLLVLPFGGPLPGGKAGLDLDGDYFDEETDIYGPFPGLRATRERMVDWHHDGFGVPQDKQWMKGSVLGRIVLDEEPSEFKADDDIYEGIAADWWAKVGEQRLALIRSLQKRGSSIFGSSQAVAGAIRKADTGNGNHVEVWPLVRHTISTSPQNTHALVPDLKALLTADLDFGEVGIVALKAAIIGLDALTFGSEPHSADDPSGGAEEALKAGRVLSGANERALRQALDELAKVLAKLPQAVVEDMTEEGEPVHA